MKYEIRIRDINNLAKAIELCPDVICVGDEGCWHKLPDLETIIESREMIEQAGIRFRCITPKISQAHIEAAITLISELSKKGKKYYLTINDIGLLYGCKEKNILPDDVAIGRSIAKSLIDCLWYNEFLVDEDENVKKTLYQNYMAHKVKIDYFSKLGIKSVEINMVEKQDDAIQNFTKNGWEVHLHYGFVTVAFSRVCQTAKFDKVKVGDECHHLCNKTFELEMSQIWDRGEFEEMDEALKEMRPEFVLRGNVLYRENTMKSNPYKPCSINSLIFSDWQFNNLDQLGAVIDRQKESRL